MANNDYIDTVVLVDKPDLSETAPDHDVVIKPKVPNVDEVRLTRVGGIEVNTLTLDETLDDDGDPYNSTGKHCTLKFKE